MTRSLVTGGTGFIGSALVRRLVAEGHRVRVLDSGARGKSARLADVAAEVEVRTGDVRDPDAVREACAGIDVIWHLAAVNGTENFYRHPDLVLDVGVRGMLTVLDGARARGVRQLFLASSSEAYASPPRVPTDERVPLAVPDPLNPRWSYGGSKIVSELLALHSGQAFERVVVFRPHNVYGPDMGWEHVIPQLTLRARTLAPSEPLPIQGDGRQTRAFCHVDDLVGGLMILLARASHRGIYNVGNDEEIAIADLARAIGRCLDRDLAVVPGPPAPGGTERRRPDLAKIRSLGYEPRVPLGSGLPPTVRWYDEHADEAPARA